VLRSEAASLSAFVAIGYYGEVGTSQSSIRTALGSEVVVWVRHMQALAAGPLAP